MKTKTNTNKLTPLDNVKAAHRSLSEILEEPDWATNDEEHERTVALCAVLRQYFDSLESK